MDKRTNYAVFEKLVLNLYDRKMLTLDLLDSIARRYRLVSIDSAGSRSMRTQDGKDLHQVCIKLVDPTFQLAANGSSGDHEEYWEHELKAWENIVNKRWRWCAYCNAFPFRRQQDNAA